MTSSSWRPLLAVALTGMLVLSVALAAGPAMAQDGEDPPDPEVPAAYYGSITIDGEPADPGVTVEAVIEDGDQDSITVETAGTYGGPDVEDEKLSVQGYEDEEVRFYASGDDFNRTQADQTVTLQEFDDRELNLTVSTDTTNGDGVPPSGPDPGDPDPGDPDPAEPVATIAVEPDTTVSAGDELEFSGAASSVSNGEITGYDWSVDGESLASGESTTTSFDEAGQYTIELLVTTDAGLTATEEATVTVESPPSADGEDSMETNGTDEADDGNGEDDTIPGFGIIAALVVGGLWLVRLTGR